MGSSDVCAYPGCGRAPHYMGRCIFHAEQKDPHAFRSQLAAQIREWRNRSETVDKWDFRGWVFVDTKRKGSLGWRPENLFRSAVFPVAADFTSAKFTRKACFIGARFMRESWLVRTTFMQGADFSSATFTRTACFGVAEFMGDGDFGGATFGQNANFKLAVFRLNAHFSEVIFAEEVTFLAATFTLDADFIDSTFTWDAEFVSTTFAKRAMFDRATFTQGANFYDAVFRDTADFPEITALGWLRLRSLRFPQQGGYLPFRLNDVETGDKGVIDLRDNDLQEHNPVIIRDCNLGRILLSNTDFEHVRLYVKDQDYETVRDRFLWGLFRPARRCTGDEWVRTEEAGCGIPDNELPTWNDVELTYQELARVFRESFNHPVANDCERGFFEARRNAEKGKGKLRDWCNYCVISVYKYASYYSGLIWLPVVWLLAATLLIFPGLYDLTLLRRDLVFMPPARYWPSLDAMIASLRVAALDRAWLSRKMLGDGNPLAVIPRGDQFWVSLIAVVQLVATAALIALFILALRRRFKHGD